MHLLVSPQKWNLQAFMKIEWIASCCGHAQIFVAKTVCQECSRRFFRVTNEIFSRALRIWCSKAFKKGGKAPEGVVLLL